MTTVRPMVAADDVAVSEIVSECYRFIAGADGLTASQCDKMIAERCTPGHMAINRDRFTCHVAEQDGKVVGFIAYSATNIEELFVHPLHHRCGIATALFRKAESACRHSTLTVATTGYGLPFYRAMGMQVTGKRPVTFGPLEGRDLIQLASKARGTPLSG